MKVVEFYTVRLSRWHEAKKCAASLDSVIKVFVCGHHCLPENG